MCHFYWFLKNVSEKFFECCLFCKKCILQKWRQYQFRAVSYRKTCLKMAPNNKLMSEVHSNASQEVIFEMAPFPSWYHAKYIFSLIFRWFSSKNAKKIDFFSTNVQRKNGAIKPFTKFKSEKMSANVAETCVFPPSMFNCHLNQYNRNGAIFSVWLLNFKQKNS